VPAATASTPAATPAPSQAAGEAATPEGQEQPQEPAEPEILASTAIGSTPATLTYNVYEVKRDADVPAGAAESPAAAPEAPPPAEPSASAAPTDAAKTAGTDAAKAANTRLTGSPVSDPSYVDKRITWGDERCYEVRTVETINGLSVESAGAPPVCTTLVDTFPPQAPTGLTAVPSQGTISLIWQPNDEKDLQGYLVLRGTDPDQLEAITPMPIQETTFKDTVAAGERYSYVIKAIDQAGNVSEASNRVEETGR
jgi:hypothetical protein